MKLKKTKTRELILEMLQSSTVPLSAGQIFDNLRGEDITLSSIYRSLDTFTRNNIIHKETDVKAVAYYSIIKDEHSHLLMCRVCNDKVELNYCPYHKANKDIEKSTSFKVDEHNVVIYGTCNDCKKK